MGDLKKQLKQGEQKQQPEKKEEKLSRREWEELMGIRSNKYYRGHGGAFRQK